LTEEEGTAGWMEVQKSLFEGQGEKIFSASINGHERGGGMKNNGPLVPSEIKSRIFGTEHKISDPSITY
jgi:hypothetical protein